MSSWFAGNGVLAVDPKFRSSFELPLASLSYTDFMSKVPQLLVLEEHELEQLVLLLARRVACEFEDKVRCFSWANGRKHIYMLVPFVLSTPH